MRVLHLTLDLPLPANRGAQIRDHALIRRLSQSCEIDLVALCETPPKAQALDAMRAICHSVEVHPLSARTLSGQGMAVLRTLWHKRPLATAPYVQDRVLRQLAIRLRQEKHDIFQVEHSFLAPYLRAAQGLPVATILSLHNVGALQYARLADLPAPFPKSAVNAAKARLMRGWEATWSAGSDAVIAMSPEDARALRAEGYRGDPVVIPNAVDRVPDLGPPQDRAAMLFVGNFQYPPNADAALVFAREVMPLLRKAGYPGRFLVAGLDPPASIRALADAPDIEVFAGPEVLTPLYARAGVVVAPLRAGGGTRLKILEAMAHGRPVIATALAAEGIGTVEGRTIALAETAEAFAAEILAIHDDPAAAQARASRARDWVAAHRSWDGSAAALADLYRRLLAARCS